MLIRRALVGFVLPVAAGLVLVASGDSTHDSMNMTAGPSTRTVNIEMTDLAFTPAAISVKAGETVKFVLANKGKVQHDAFIGDTAAQMQHGMEMNSGSGTMAGHSMTGGHDGITVQPGKTGTLTMTFDHAAMLELGCHQPGHYEAGMKAMINVA